MFIKESTTALKFTKDSEDIFKTFTSTVDKILSKNESGKVFVEEKKKLLEQTQYEIDSVSAQMEKNERIANRLKEIFN